jgi:dihydrofolate synthase/folylpolyglutamate synthase
VCGIASLGIDHEVFLLAPEEGVPQEPLARIAFEKAGIAKPRVRLVTQAYPIGAAKAVIDSAMTAGARPATRGLDWFAETAERLAYRDAGGALDLPLPALAGAHQADNAALAVAMLRHQDALEVTPEAMAEGIRTARWPGRLQRLRPGPLTALVPGRKVWLDGGHNPDAGEALASFFGANVGVGARALHLILGMLANKNPAAIIEPLAPLLASVTVVPIPGHEAHPAQAFGMANAAPDVATALAALPPGDDVLIAGSLYLAGAVLAANGEAPD